MKNKVLACGACSAALLGILPMGTAAQGGPVNVAVQLTHSINADLSLSPDGKEFVYISVIAGKEQLFRMGIDGSNPRQLTQDDADHEDPAWSLKGNRIAFVLKKRGLEQIYLMNADGSAAEPLTPKETRTIHPDWSPDGLSVAYCTDDDLQPPKKNPSNIYSIEIASRRITKLLSGGVNTYPAWSPDGKKLAFRRMVGENNSEIFIANGDGTGEQNLTDHPAFDGWPAWSPDGNKIAFASNRDGNYEIYVMNVEGSGVQKVANNEGRATAPKWSKDGKTIYFSICKKEDSDFDCQIYTAKLDAVGKH